MFDLTYSIIVSDWFSLHLNLSDQIKYKSLTFQLNTTLVVLIWRMWCMI